MARKMRVEFDGAIYHVMCRGLRRGLCWGNWVGKTILRAGPITGEGWKLGRAKESRTMTAIWNPCALKKCQEAKPDPVPGRSRQGSREISAGWSKCGTPGSNGSLSCAPEVAPEASMARTCTREHATQETIRLLPLPLPGQIRAWGICPGVPRCSTPR